MSGEPLPSLLDVKQLRGELGVSRAAAEAIMRQVPTVVIPGRGGAARAADVLEDGRSRMMGPTTQAARQRVNAPGPARGVTLMRCEPYNQGGR